MDTNKKLGQAPYTHFNSGSNYKAHSTKKSTLPYDEKVSMKLLRKS